MPMVAGLVVVALTAILAIFSRRKRIAQVNGPDPQDPAAEIGNHTTQQMCHLLYFFHFPSPVLQVKRLHVAHGPRRRVLMYS